MSKKEQPGQVDNSYSDNVLDDLLNSLSGPRPISAAPQKEAAPAKGRAQTPPPPPPPKPAPAAARADGQEQLHAGHRERVRQKFMAGLSFKGFSDHEILELLLYYVIPRNDVNGLAHTLIKKFGGFCGVLNAPYEELAACTGLNEQSALYIKILMRLCAKYNVDMQQRILVSNAESLEDYMIYQFSGETEECAKLFLVDSHDKLSAPHEVGRGLEGRSVFNFKKAMNIIVNSASSYVILAHNHISSTAAPSENDVVVTRRFKQMISPIGVTLIDHFVICGSEVSSMRALGLMET